MFFVRPNAKSIPITHSIKGFFGQYHPIKIGFYNLHSRFGVLLEQFANVLHQKRLLLNRKDFIALLNQSNGILPATSA